MGADSDWVETTLGEVVELKRGYDLPKEKRSSGVIPIVSSSGVTDFHYAAMEKGPGVVTGRYGTIGEVFYVEHDYWPLNTTLYVCDFKGNDPRFISYFLKTLDFQAYSDKGAVPGLNRNHLHLANVRVPHPKIQVEIARILASLDDKIALNRRINQTLEAMAQALFQSWFVDFDPVKAKVAARREGRDPLRAAMTAISGKADADLDALSTEEYERLAATAALFPDEMQESELGEIPGGWGASPLDSIAGYMNGLAMQKFPPETPESSLPVIKIAQLRAGNTAGADRASADLEPNFVVLDGDVLFSWSGSLEVDIWTGGRGALNQHLFKVTSNIVPKWFYLLATKHHLSGFREIAANKATTMGHIQRKHLSSALIAVPPQTFTEVADRTFAPILEQQIVLRIEARELASIRDILLPKLLSGELSTTNGHGEADS